LAGNGTRKLPLKLLKHIVSVAIRCRASIGYTSYGV